MERLFISIKRSLTFTGEIDLKSMLAQSLQMVMKVTIEMLGTFITKKTGSSNCKNRFSDEDKAAVLEFIMAMTTSG